VFYDMGLIERYGSGIRRILDACREAGLPQPILENFSGGFRIKFMLPEHVTGEVTPHVTPQVTPQVKALLDQVRGEINRDEVMKRLSLRDREHFRKTYLLPALEAELIEMTIPEKPRSSKQSYRLTEKGRALRSAHHPPQ
jgi:ATP-dependent DNA helicase RecG